jgi:hypothetical protein
MDSYELTMLDGLLPRGRENATSIPTLVDKMMACRSGWAYMTEARIIRDGLQQLVNERRVPVVTLPTNPGVFVAVTPEELDLADAHLRSKAMALLKRRRSLRLCREALGNPTLFDMEGV